MRLRGLLLVAAAGSAAAMLTLAGPAAGAGPLHCGDILAAAGTYNLYGNLDCNAANHPGSAIYIGHADVTLNLNGYTITSNFEGGGSGNYDVIDNVTYGPNDNLTINGGGGGLMGWIGVDNGLGGANLHVLNTAMEGQQTLPQGKDIGFIGVLSSPDGFGDCHFTEGSDERSQVSGLVVQGSPGMGEFAFDVYLNCNTGALIKSNHLSVEQDVLVAGGDYLPDPFNNIAIYEHRGTSNTMWGNAITGSDPPAYPAPRTGYGLYTDWSAGTTFSTNATSDVRRGVYSENNDARLMVIGNTFNHENNGIEIDNNDAGDMIENNLITSSVYQGVNDDNSFNNLYVGNTVMGAGQAGGDYDGFHIHPDGAGPVTMVNNAAATIRGYGFHVSGAYTESVPGGNGVSSSQANGCLTAWSGYSCFAGNSAFADGAEGYQGGFYDEYSVGATWMSNVASNNGYYGFEFISPWRETISGNVSHDNGGSGFYFLDNATDSQPFSVNYNTSNYNEEWGFYGEAPTVGNNNSATGNVYGPSWLVAGVG